MNSDKVNVPQTFILIGVGNHFELAGGHIKCFSTSLCAGGAPAGHGGGAGDSHSDGSVGCEGAQRHSEGYRGDAARSGRQGESKFV